MYISTPSGVCDTCHIAQEGTLEELIEEYHWELDEFDQLYCGGCTLGREYAATQAAQATEELEAAGAIIDEDPAVQALGEEAGTFNTNEAAVLAEVAKVNKKRAAKRRKAAKSRS